MSQTDALFTQPGRVARRLARQLLRHAPGDQLPRNVDIADREGVGHGTVQAALRMLSDLGAASLSSHGALGTQLTDLNYPMLWELAGIGPMVGLMPLPYSRRYEGLATAFAQLLEASNVPFRLAYLRGGRARLGEIGQHRAHFAVMSALAAATLQAQAPQIRVLHDYGPGSYVTGHLLYVRKEKTVIEVVGVDADSTDQVELTRAEFESQPVRQVPFARTHPWSLLSSGEFDAVVWNADMAADLPAGIIAKPLTSALAVSNEHTRAVLVAGKNGPACQFLKNYLPVSKVLAIQEDVLAGRSAPSY